jgi:VanZ family protein
MGAIFVMAQIAQNRLPDSQLGGGLAHFAAFYSLALLGAAAFPSVRIVLLALGLLSFGVTIELFQEMLPYGRKGEVYDVLADSAGMLSALAPLYFVEWRNRAARAEQATKSE